MDDVAADLGPEILNPASEAALEASPASGVGTCATLDARWRCCCTAAVGRSIFLFFSSICVQLRAGVVAAGDRLFSFLLLIFGNEVFYERSPESPQRTIRKTAQRFCCISALPLVFLKLLISVSSRICVALAIVPCTRQQIRAIAVRTHERARCDSRTPSSAFNWARQLLKCAPALDMFR